MAIEFVSKSKLPTSFGDFEIIAFQDESIGEEHRGGPTCLNN